MRKIFVAVAVALTPIMAATAFAQATPPSGEVDASQGKAPPVANQTPEQKAAGKKHRRSSGHQAARGPQMGEGPDKPEATPEVSSEARKSAAAHRRAKNRAANEAGEFPRGGNTSAPEMQQKPKP